MLSLNFNVLNSRGVAFSPNYSHSTFLTTLVKEADYCYAVCKTIFSQLLVVKIRVPDAFCLAKRMSNCRHFDFFGVTIEPHVLLSCWNLIRSGKSRNGINSAMIIWVRFLTRCERRSLDGVQIHLHFSWLRRGQYYFIWLTCRFSKFTGPDRIKRRVNMEY